MFSSPFSGDKFLADHQTIIDISPKSTIFNVHNQDKWSDYGLTFARKLDK